MYVCVCVCVCVHTLARAVSIHTDAPCASVFSFRRFLLVLMFFFFFFFLGSFHYICTDLKQTVVYSNTLSSFFAKHT